jgi:hypothetical protein
MLPAFRSAHPRAERRDAHKIIRDHEKVRAGREGPHWATESPGREVAVYQPKPAATVALSSQYWVCSSVQPGTAKRAGAVIL